MSTPITIDVVSDVVCPWCFIGKRRLEGALATLQGTAVAVRWRPFQLDPTIPPQGLAREDYLKRKFGPEHIAEIHRSLLTVGALEGIDFRFDLIKRSPNTLNAHRLISWAADRSPEENMVERLFRIYFSEGGDIGSSNVLATAAAELGFDREEAEKFLAGDEKRDEVQAQVEMSSHMGVTGVPTFIIANRYAVIGAQEPRYIAGAIAKARAEAAGEAQPSP
jgi:predicted DsbA family dithiol-disulfide isomerase